jgi:hypothetical protein
LWAQFGGRIRPGEGRFLQKDSAEKLAVGNLLPFGKGTICADFAGWRDDVARAEGTNGWISIRGWAINEVSNIVRVVLQESCHDRV